MAKITNLFRIFLNPSFYKQYKIIDNIEDIDYLREIKNRNFLIIGSIKKKWAHFLCPCGCGDIIELNLMKTHFPFWNIKIINDNKLRIYPSIINNNCGSHFWVVNNKVIWVDEK